MDIITEKTGVYHYHRRKPATPIPNVVAETKIKEQRGEKIEELEGRIQFLEAALNMIIHHSDNTELQKRLEKLTQADGSEKRIRGWNQGKRRVLHYLKDYKNP